jgi:hypothetical protein
MWEIPRSRRVKFLLQDLRKLHGVQENRHLWVKTIATAEMQNISEIIRK